MVQVIDFGSGCFESETKYTYIQSRFYRAPEVVLGMRYGREIDMWSFALILVEIFTGVPLFPGRDEHEQLACIMEVLGLPPIDMRENCKRRHQFFDSQLHPILRANPEGKFRIPGSMVSLSRLILFSQWTRLDFNLRMCLCRLWKKLLAALTKLFCLSSKNVFSGILKGG